MKGGRSERILIVDDHEINRYATGRILREAGYFTFEAASGQDAIHQAQTMPDLILLDVNLPDIDGFQVCRLLRGETSTAEIPIVHTSATFISVEDRIQGLDVGADGYLTRPIEPRVLVATIRSCLRARRAEDFLRQRERELQSLADNTPDLIARFDSGMVHLFVNRATEYATGMASAGLLGKTTRMLGLPGGLCDVLDTSLQKVFESGVEGRFEFWLEQTSGTRRYSSMLTPEFSTDREVRSVLLVARDVTDQYRAELEREKFVSLVEHSRDFIAIYNAQGKPTYINQAGLDLIGLANLEEAQTVPLREIFSQADFQHIEDEFLPRVLINGHGDCEVQIQNRKTGTSHWLNCSLVVQREHAAIVGFSAICREISEHKLLEEKLRRVASDLSDANRKMNEFLATLAHELRNPMAPIRTGLEVIRISLNDPEIIESTRGMMERQAHQMIRLIDDLLDLSRITQGKLNLKKARIDLADALGSAVDAIRPAINEAGHALHISLPDTPIMLDGDPNRLAQVFANILNNASKYTTGRGEIWLSATVSEGLAEVCIRDSGLGIPDAMQQRIFEMFTQIDRPIELGYTGLGIGLTLVKRIVEMHAGSVSVFSQGTNQGSKFTIKLPVAVDDLGLSDGLTSGRVQGGRRHRVLVVDDNRDSAQLLGLILKVLGNEICLAHDGYEAIEAAESFLPSVVLMDLGMPKMNGFEAARAIRLQSWGVDMVLVALTGWGQEEDKQRTEEAGFNYHLTKPAEPAEIQRLLDSLP